jgi:uncharacterized protein YodC (DUF2158 family)
MEIFMDFKPGDIVMLKSGGPNMTIGEIVPSGSNFIVYCDWFDGTKFERYKFFYESLKLV